MKKHLLLTMEYPPDRGGVSRYLEAIVLAFPDRFRVVASSGIAPPLFFSRMYPAWLRSLFLLWRLRKECDEVWVSHVLPLGTVAWLFHLMRRVPYVVILHGMDFELARHSAFHRLLLRTVLAHARCVLTNSQALADDVTAAYRFVRPGVLHPALPASFHPKPRIPHLAQPLRLLTVSRLVSRKNHEEVLRALALWRHPFVYTIVGEGPVRLSLERLASDLHLGSSVVFTGAVDETALADYYAAADIFLLPVKKDLIDREGFGIVYLEAAASGLPIIATNQRGVLEALHQSGSLVISEPTAEVIADAIETLAKDAILREKMGQINIAFAKTFSAEIFHDTLERYV